ncbi:Rv3235 family protein [Demetria terragena]|uniref:Rv3235 family protein n=1 Tax=Demetria terragena TaxID=63959 RepID=UPI000366FB87|nr:Rv3235 family protein [Demetria terragena]
MTTLTDSSKMSIRPRPDVEPPALSHEAVRARYAKAHRGGLRLSHQATYVQGSLAMDFRTAEYDPHFGPQATPRANLPEPRQWATQLVAMLVECAHGARSPKQLLRWMTPECQQLVAQRHLTSVRRGGALHPTAIRRVRVCEPTDGVAEVSAVVLLEGRPCAIAMRLNGADGRWLTTVLVIG